MKKIKYVLAVSAFLVLTAFTINEAMDWKIAKNYSVKFAGTDAEGVFKTINGSIQFDQSDLATSKCSFSIPVNSINTGNGTKNKHAVSDKWFDAKQYPNITFISSAFTTSKSGYAVKGIMEIHGVQKEMTLPFSFTENTFNSKFSVNRLDFKVGTMNGMSKKVSNEIKLDISLPVTKM